MAADDVVLRQRAKDGDQQAFIRLMQGYESVIEQIVQEHVGFIAGHEPENVSDEVLKGLWKAIRTSDEHSASFEAWLRYTTKTLCEELQSEDDLLERAKQGDENAFARLIVRHDSAIRYVIRKYRRKIYGYDEDDLVQEVIVKTYRKIRNFRENAAAFKGYVCTIAKFHCLDILDGYRKRPYPEVFEESAEFWQQVKDWGNDVVEVFQENPTPLDGLLRQEVDECVEQTINSLPVAMRDVMVLRFKADMKYKDIAKRLNRKLGTVKTQLNRAIEKIQEQCGA